MAQLSMSRKKHPPKLGDWVRRAKEGINNQEDNYILKELKMGDVLYGTTFI